VEYLKYTFATLGFAKNASVVKLTPKKATVAASAAERKLMAELDVSTSIAEWCRDRLNSCLVGDERTCGKAASNLDHCWTRV
jgi:hypothetical protein